MKNVTLRRNNRKVGEAIRCDTMLKRFLGLMFRKEQSAVIILPYESRALATLHTFFMRFSIDVAWLDKDKRTVDVRNGIKPCRQMIVPKGKAKYIIEVPAGNKLKMSDRFDFA